MRHTIGSILVIILFLTYFQTAFSQQTKPEPVLRIVYAQKSDDWYNLQAKLWKKEIDKNPKNVKAWHNYYNAVRYGNFFDSAARENKKEKMDQIVADLSKYAPDSWEYYYLRGFDDTDFDQKIKYIEKAYKIDPTRPDTYYEFISYYAIKGNEDNVTEFYKKLYLSKDIAAKLVEYNYNVLMSTEPNSILFTNGDNDTYPARMLQEAKGIRTDVTILNASMIFAGTYLERNLKKLGIDANRRKLMEIAQKKDKNIPSFRNNYFRLVLDKIVSAKPDIPVYFASTLYQSFYEDKKDDTYIVGLAFRYSKDRIDNIALIKRNFEKNYRLDYLKNDWYAEEEPINSIMAQLNNNYVPPLIMLAEFYKNSGETAKLEDVKKLVYDIAYAAGRNEVIEYFNSKIK